MLRNNMLDYMSEVTSAFSFENLSETQPFQTETIAGYFHIDRTRASRILNQLVKEHVLLKVNTRPVCFFTEE